MLLAEANQWPEDTQDYFGDGDECHMAFHFPLMPRMYMAIAQEDRFPITDILRQTPDIPDNCQWAIFLRNHDELTLEMVTDKERDYLWNTYAADRRARINLGIRRRLAPLMERDRRRIELMNCAAAVDARHAGDLLRRRDRHGRQHPSRRPRRRAHADAMVDRPQRRLLARRSGQSGAAADHGPALRLPGGQRRSAGARPAFAAQLDAADARGAQPAPGLRPRHARASCIPTNRKFWPICASTTASTILCVANVLALARRRWNSISANSPAACRWRCSGGSVFPPIGQLTYLLTLPPYGFYWFVLADETEAPSWHTPAPEPMPDYETLVLRSGVDDAMQVEARKTLETAVLPSYLAKRRWFSGKDQKQIIPRIKSMSRIEGRGLPVGLIEVEVTGGAEPTRWLLPLAVVSEDEHVSALANRLALARVRRGREVQLLTDAFALPGFAHAIATSLKAGARLPAGDGEIVFEQADNVDIPTLPDDAEINWLSAEQSNSSLIAGDLMMIKVLRKIAPGKHPEAEMGRYLTENGYANAALFLGEMVRVSEDGTRSTLAIVQGFLRNEGDAWTWTLDHLTRALDDFGARGGGDMSEHDRFSEFTAFAANLGTRLAELHAVLARPTDDPAFAPGPPAFRPRRQQRSPSCTSAARRRGRCSRIAPGRTGGTVLGLGASGRARGPFLAIDTDRSRRSGLRGRLLLGARELRVVSGEEAALLAGRGRAATARARGTGRVRHLRHWRHCGTHLLCHDGLLS